MQWENYHARIGERPSEIACALTRHLKGPRKVALDLGAGHLRDSRFLLKSGFEKVVAVDVHTPPTQHWVHGIDFRQSLIEHFIPREGVYDGCIATNSLYFCPKRTLETTFKRVHGSLRKGGIFVCNLLTEADPWVREYGCDKIAWVTDENLGTLENGFKIILSESTSKLRDESSSEKKDWHCHIFILEKE